MTGFSDTFTEALKLFHPFLGAENWKYSATLPAFLHSASAAYTAYSLANIVNPDLSETAFYAALLHDFYQKVHKEVTGLREFVKGFVDDKEALDAINYNLAENPDVMPDLGWLVWFGDMVQAKDMNVVEMERLVQKVSEKYKKKLYTYFITVTLPQIGTRSALMNAALSKIPEDSLVLLSKDGAYVITDKQLQMPLTVDINDIRFALPESIKDSWAETDPALLEDFENGEPKVYTEGMFYNLAIQGFDVGSKPEKVCLTCGLPAPKLYAPQAYGYALYSRSNNEKWSPKVKPLTNLNADFSKRNRKYGMCFWCAYDSAYLANNSFTSARSEEKHFLVGYFTRLVPKKLVDDLAMLLGANVDFREVGGIDLDDFEQGFEDWVSFVDSLTGKGIFQGKTMSVIVDYSSALVVRDFGSVVKNGKRSYLLGDEPILGFVKLLPSLATLAMVSMFYPLKVTLLPDQVIPDRVISYGKSFAMLEYNPYYPKENTSLPPVTLALLHCLKVYSEERERMEVLDMSPEFTKVALHSICPKLGESLTFFKSDMKRFYGVRR
jgi:hypothetical protein